jgi:hypothetical protein
LKEEKKFFIVNVDGLIHTTKMKSIAHFVAVLESLGLMLRKRLKRKSLRPSVSEGRLVASL